jgi:phosphate transport system substrate-binding protein
MKIFKILGYSLLMISAPTWADAMITGAGASFPYPLYEQWAQNYQKQTQININYQPIGSGGGIQQIIAKTVNFGASDKPLSTAELTKNQLTQFPTVVGGVVAVVNIPGLEKKSIRLSGPVLADIYRGKITHWNDPLIIALNPGVTLPKQIITVVHRSDGSGTTFLFTHYLSDVSPDWKTSIGADTNVAWPAGVGGKGNEGVTSYVQRIKGSIGYVEYAYADQNHLNYALLQNQAGHTVSPSLNSFAAAAKYAHWSSANHFGEILTNEPGADSWPIVGATFILLNTTPADAEKNQEVLKFFDWAYHHGQADALKLNYVPLPDSVVKLIQDEWRIQLKWK